MLCFHGSFPNVSKFLWLQEEPANAGAWSYVAPHLVRALHKASHVKQPVLQYIGRPALPTPAVGLAAAHKQQAEALLEEVWTKAL